MCIARLVVLMVAGALGAVGVSGPAVAADVLPTGQMLTPTAAPGSRHLELRAPGASRASGQAVSTARSPDGRTLLVLTSGFNAMFAADGAVDPARSRESIFVYDISRGHPVRTQVLRVPNAFVGLAFAPDGRRFYVSGGKDDCVHVFVRHGARWTEAAATIALGNGPGNALDSRHSTGPWSVAPLAADLALTANGRALVVANYENDSISIVDLGAPARVATLDLRPGKLDPSQRGVAGGEFPFGLAIRGNDTAYVSSVRDREIVVVSLVGPPRVVARIPTRGNPNRMLLDRDGRQLFVAVDNTDRIEVIDTRTLKIVGGTTTRTAAALGHDASGPGASPNALALSPDERTLYVTNGGENAVAVVDVDAREHEYRLRGSLPTGWYPHSVSASADGGMLYVVNGKSMAGPNPRNCVPVVDEDLTATGCPPTEPKHQANQYILQLMSAGLLSLPTPSRATLASLTRQVGRNNGVDFKLTDADIRTFTALRERIRHVIYVIKENRTYDQVLGDLPGANGDAALAQFPRRITPNLHALASRFVTLDNFYCSSEVSQGGWQWSTGARSVDLNEKTTPLAYAERGASYDSESTSRNINTGAATVADRAALNPIHLRPGFDDPDLLPGTRNEVELDSADGEPGAGYLWDAALRAGKTVRNYGFYVDLARYAVPADLPDLDLAVPVSRDPRAAGIRVAFPASVALAPYTDPYFRGFDTKLPDFYRYREWATEFDGYVASGTLPDLSLVRLMNDHMGTFKSAIDGVNTPETQQADNDYAVGLLVQKVAASRYATDTLIFILEDDAQDGPDHVDAHRSPAYVVGPYVRQGGAIVSDWYSTVSMIRTIEEVLGLAPLNLHDSSVAPMSAVFDLRQADWSFQARPSAVLRTTALPLPPPTADELADGAVLPQHDADWWAAATRDFDFSREDQIDADAFNRVVWRGTMGGIPYDSGRGATTPP